MTITTHSQFNGNSLCAPSAVADSLEEARALVKAYASLQSSEKGPVRRFQEVVSFAVAGLEAGTRLQVRNEVGPVSRLICKTLDGRLRISVTYDESNQPIAFQMSRTLQNEATEPVSATVSA